MVQGEGGKQENPGDPGQGLGLERDTDLSGDGQLQSQVESGLVVCRRQAVGPEKAVVAVSLWARSSPLLRTHQHSVEHRILLLDASLCSTNERGSFTLGHSLRKSTERSKHPWVVSKMADIYWGL